jgi:hypothetical protein
MLAQAEIIIALYCDDKNYHLGKLAGACSLFRKRDAAAA